MKCSLFHRPLGGAGPERHRPTLYSLSLNTPLCNGARGDEPALNITTIRSRCIYQEWVSLGLLCLLLMEFIVSFCVCAWEWEFVFVWGRRWGYRCGKPLHKGNVYVDASYNRCLVLFCWLCNTFNKPNLFFLFFFFHRLNLSPKQPGKFVAEVCYQHRAVLRFILHHMSWVLLINTSVVLV